MMLEPVKTFRVIGMEWMYFACKKGVNFGGPGMECCRPNVSPQIHRLKLNPQCDDIWRWSLWEVIRSWGGKCPYERVPEGSLTSSTMWGHRENIAVNEPGNRFSPDTKSTGPLILDIPDSKIVKNKFKFSINHPVYSIFVIAAGSD